MRISVSKIPFLSHDPSSSVSSVVCIIIGLLLKTRHVLFTALAVKKSKFIKTQLSAVSTVSAVCCLVVCHLTVCCLFSVCWGPGSWLCPHGIERTRTCAMPASYKGTHLVLRFPPSQPSYLPKDPATKTIPKWTVAVWIWEGTQTFGPQ